MSDTSKHRTYREKRKMMVQESLHARNEVLFQGTWYEPRVEVYDKFVLAAIDDCFSSFGDSAKQAIYLHLKEHHNIDRTEIPAKIGDFAEALEESYGVGAKLIEIEIMKIIHRKAPHFKHSPDTENLSFSSYVETLRYFL